MNKIVKILLWIVGGFVVLFVAAAVALPLIIDPNDYRDDISAAVKKSTGRELVLGGPIKLRVFPWLGARVQDVTLGNAQGFGPEPFAKVGDAEVSVRLLPLILHREVRVGTLTLDGLALNLTKAADGKTNWDDLAGGAKKQPEQKPAGGPGISGFGVSSVEIKDAALSYDDRAAKASYKLEKINLSTGSLSPGEPVDIDLSFLANVSQPQMTADVKLSGTAKADPNAKIYNFDDMKLKVVTSGPGIPGGEQKLTAAGALAYDQGQGTFAFSNGLLEAADLKLKAAIQGKSMNTDKPALTGLLSAEPFSPRKLVTAFGIELPPTADDKALSEASLSANYEGDFNSAWLNDVKFTLDQTHLTGRLGVRDLKAKALEFQLAADSIDADRYLPPPAKEESKGAPAQNINDTRLPVDLLDAFNVNGAMDIGTLKLKGATLTKVKLRVAGQQGHAKQEDLTAQLYGGSIAHHATITPGKQPRYASKATLTAVNAGPLLTAVLGKDYVTGLAKFNLDATGTGTTVGDVRKSLNGDLAFAFENGAVKGFNLADTIGRAKATLNAQPYTATGPDQTEFGELKGTAKIVNGVLKTDDLAANNPLFNLLGQGQADLYNNKIDFTAKPLLTEKVKSQAGGGRLAELAGLTIPIKLSGDLFAPHVKVDLASALKEKATATAQKQVDKQKEKLFNKFNKKFGNIFGAPEKDQNQQPPPQNP